MNRTIFTAKRIVSLLVSLMMTAASVQSVCLGAEADDRFVYRSSDAWNEQVTPDSVWQFLYRNNSTSTAATEAEQYVPYTVAGAGLSSEFAEPTKNDDDTYNYNASSTDQVVYADSNSKPGRRNALGKYWARLSVATGDEPRQGTENRIVKQFTAPREGNVIISAEDMSGDAKIYNRGLSSGNSQGAVVRIVKKADGQSDTELWNHTFAYNSNTKNTIESIDFKGINVDLAEGDKLWFEISSENGGSSWAKQVFWDPVVIYSYTPENIEPSNLDSVSLDAEFTVTFRDEVNELTADNIEIEGKGSPTVAYFSQSDDMRSITFSFDGLSSESDYSVIINGIKLEGSNAELSSAFDFTTEYVFEYPEYTASYAWSYTSNTDSVWRWLYRNAKTAAAETQYLEYSILGTATTEQGYFDIPKKNSDGVYDYSTAENNAVTVFADSSDHSGKRNALGKYWARPAVATMDEPKNGTENRIVKQFTAPESGKVVISAKDLEGAARIYNRTIQSEWDKLNGAVIRIIKKNDTSGDETLFEHEFAYKESSCPENGVGVYDFEDIECELEKGDKLWFEISSEMDGTAYAKQVFWNPSVRYTEIYPNVASCEPENGSQGIAPNFEHVIKFDREITDISTDDITVEPYASCKSVRLEDGNKTLRITYTGLKANTEYTIEINGVCAVETNDNFSKPYRFAFKTGDTVQIGTVQADGALKAGRNTIRVPINNAGGNENPYKAALAAFICKKSDNGFEVVSAKSIYRDDIGENDELAVTVELADAENYFIKAILLESFSSARAILPMTEITN